MNGISIARLARIKNGTRRNVSPNQTQVVVSLPVLIVVVPMGKLKMYIL